MATRTLLHVCTALLAAAIATAAQAHNLELTRTLLLLKADGGYQVDMTCDLDALALGVNPSADSAELASVLAAMPAAELEAQVDQLRRTFERRVRIRFDGEAVTPVVGFPAFEASRQGAATTEPAGTASADPTVLGLIARLEGRVPIGATAVTFRASRAFPAVHLTILDERRLTGERQLLEAGVASQPYRLDGEPADPPAADSDRLATAGHYLVLGFWHIVPEGLDHILFVLGLFLLAARWRPLLWQVSAFSAAHTLTLALSTYGVIRLPPSLVEPLIALSIAYVAIENLWTTELKPWRPAVVFAFGLLHGLGFAGVLGELGLPESERLTALLAFNAGVELGQLAVLLAAFAAIGWLRHRSWYRRRIVVPSSLAIAATGLFWALQRMLAA